MPCACERAGEEDPERKGEERDGLATKLSSVCLRYQLEDDGRLKLGSKGHRASRGSVGERREARSKGNASISRRSTAQRRWRDLCGIGDRIGEAAVKE